jgi:hypothetical protein
MSALSLPIHPTTGLRALGVMPSGRIVWPVLGGSGEGDGGGAGSGAAGDGGGKGEGGSSNGGGQNGDAGKTFTQADLDRIVAERLGRERSKYGDYDQLKAAADELAKLKEAQATEAEKATRQAAKDAEAKVRGELEPRMQRLEVALAHGLPEELGKRVLSAAKRLVGTTREELEADAKEFFAASPINAGKQGGGGFDQGARGGAGTSKPTVSTGADLYDRRHKKTT